MKRNILIVGYGFVGQAVANSFTATVPSARNNDIWILDPYKGHTVDAVDYSKMDAIFICVPTPTKDDVCDDSLVVGYVKTFDWVQCPVIVRSTVPPSTVKKLLDINPKLVYMPEFLREKTWQEDSLYPHMILVGTTDIDKFNEVMHIISCSSVFISAETIIRRVHPVEASLFKYSANTFLAMKVVYMHEMYKWLSDSGMGEHWDTLSGLMQSDARFGSSHFSAPGHHGLGYSGSCFPKDTQALVTESNGELSLLQATIASNNKLRSVE